MRNLKKTLAVVLALVLTLGLFTFATTSASASKVDDFTDVADISPRYLESVDLLTGIGILAGYTDGTFLPTANIKRSEAIKTIAYLVAGASADSLAAAKQDTEFSDVPYWHWASGYIAWGSANGIIKGRGNGKFDPDANVTEVEYLTMALRALGYGQNQEFDGTGYQLNVLAKAASLVDDASGISAIALGNENYSVAATREEIAYILFQALQCDVVEYTNITYQSTIYSYKSTGKTVNDLYYKVGKDADKDGYFMGLPNHAWYDRYGVGTTKKSNAYPDGILVYEFNVGDDANYNVKSKGGYEVDTAVTVNVDGYIVPGTTTTNYVNYVSLATDPNYNAGAHVWLYDTDYDGKFDYVLRVDEIVAEVSAVVAPDTTAAKNAGLGDFGYIEYKATSAAAKDYKYKVAGYDSTVKKNDAYALLIATGTGGSFDPALGAKVAVATSSIATVKSIQMDAGVTIVRKSGAAYVGDNDVSYKFVGAYYVDSDNYVLPVAPATVGTFAAPGWLKLDYVLVGQWGYALGYIGKAAVDPMDKNWAYVELIAVQPNSTSLITGSADNIARARIYTIDDPKGKVVDIALGEDLASGTGAYIAGLPYLTGTTYVDTTYSATIQSLYGGKWYSYTVDDGGFYTFYSTTDDAGRVDTPASIAIQTVGSTTTINPALVMTSSTMTPGNMTSTTTFTTLNKSTATTTTNYKNFKTDTYAATAGVYPLVINTAAGAVGKILVFDSNGVTATVNLSIVLTIGDSTSAGTTYNTLTVDGSAVTAVDVVSKSAATAGSIVSVSSTGTISTYTTNYVSGAKISYVGEDILIATVGSTYYYLFLTATTLEAYETVDPNIAFAQVDGEDYSFNVGDTINFATEATTYSAPYFYANALAIVVTEIAE